MLNFENRQVNYRTDTNQFVWILKQIVISIYIVETILYNVMMYLLKSQQIV